MGDTKIPYATRAWNVVIGCTPVSSGCDHCFARVLHNRRYLAWKQGRWEKGPPQYHQPFSKVQLRPDRLAEPLHWRKPQMVFVCSQSDLWHDKVPISFIHDVFATMGQARQHSFLVLTKRPYRMRNILCSDYFPHGFREDYGSLMIWPLPNVMLGVSVEDQATADERIPLLLETPAAKHWASLEPLLKPIDLEDYLPPLFSRPDTWLDLVIVGGESGSRFRPMDLAWAESLKAQCDGAGVNWYGKQAAGTRQGIALPGALGERAWPESAPRK